MLVGLKNKFLLIIFCLFQTTIVWAVNCNSLFTDGVQSFSNTGTITLTCPNVKILQSPDNLLEANTVTNTGACNSCNTVPCAKNTVVPIVGTMNATFITSSGAAGNLTTGNGTATVLSNTQYNTVTVSKNGTLNFSGTGPWLIKTLTITDTSFTNFPNGDVYVGTFTFAGGANNTRTITPPTLGTGTTRLFLNASTNINGSVLWNTGGTTTQAPDNMLIYQFGAANTFTLNQVGINMRALLYVQGTIQFTTTATTGISPSGFGGAAVGGNVINVGTAAFVRYAAPSAPAYGGITCVAPQVATQLVMTGVPANANYCQPVTATVTAQNADNVTVTGYSRTIILDSNNGNCTSAGGANCFGTWTKVGSPTGFNNFGGNNGYAEYTYQASDLGTAQFTLTYPANGLAVTTLRAIEKTPPTKVASDGGAGIFYFPSQIAWKGAGGIPAPYSVPQSGNGAFSPVIVLSATTPSCGDNASYTGTKTLKFWSTYINPGTAGGGPPSGTQVTINGTPIGISQLSGTNINVAFLNGIATLNPVVYADVGSIQLNLIDTTTGGPTCGSACSTGTIVVRPQFFVISGTGIPGSNNPATVPAFKKAGQNFDVTVQAMLASGGGPAKNFGLENPPESVTLSATLNAPVGGVLGTLNIVGPVTKTGGTYAGTFLVQNVNYSEVGAINLIPNVASNNYLGAGAVTYGASVVAGRFQPDHFTVTGNNNNVRFTSGCVTGGSGFTYLDQIFNYQTAPVLTVVAKNASNAITQNYHGTFKKLSPSNFPASVQVYAQTAGSPAPGFGSTVSLPVPVQTDDNLGTMTYTFSAGSPSSILKLIRPAANVTPIVNFVPNATLSVAFTDSDTPAVAGTPSPFVFNGTGTGIPFTNSGDDFRYGRLYVPNTYGSNITSMSVPIQAQYYNSNGAFTVNTLDNCTAISNVTHISINTPAPTQGGVTPSSVTPPGTFTAGAGTIVFGAPTPTATGQTNLQILLDAANANLPWLQFGWPVAPTVYGNPQGQINWGFYQGSPKVIFQKETY